MLALHECGYDVLLPFGENTRYDARDSQRLKTRNAADYEIGRVSVEASVKTGV